MAVGAALDSKCICTDCVGTGMGQDTEWDRSPHQALHCILRTGQAVGRSELEKAPLAFQILTPNASTTSIGRGFASSMCWYLAHRVSSNQHLPWAAQYTGRWTLEGLRSAGPGREPGQRSAEKDATRPHPLPCSPLPAPARLLHCLLCVSS